MNNELKGVIEDNSLNVIVQITKRYVYFTLVGKMIRRTRNHKFLYRKAWFYPHVSLFLSGCVATNDLICFIFIFDLSFSNI